MANFILDDAKKVFGGKSSLSKIILITCVTYLITNLLQYAFPIKNYFALPGDPGTLLMQPWSIVTYMFLHAGFFHILFNMLWLHWMGKILIEYLGDKRFSAVYFLGGIAGGLTYFVSYNILNATGSTHIGQLLLGASAGVMAVVFAVATLLPEFEIMLFLFGRVKMKYLALGALVLTSLLDFSVNMGGKLAHIGGAAMGYVFIKQLQSGQDWSVAFHGMISWFTGPFSAKKKMKVVSNQYKAKAPRKEHATATGSNMTAAEKQKRIDSILDKISQSGYDSLSESEKEFLFKASDKH
ncbi:MAG: rhomboid family intramembrane serine protease [Flavobacteriales bacterium]|nr:rhomboid family intramembrane serine protease [Flavobacteriales bacterium]